MKFIYVGNYLTISRDQKKEFLTLLGSFQDFRVKNQKIVLNDNSLILEFDKISDVGFAKKAIEAFFDKKKAISVKVVSKIIQNSNEVILTFDNDKQKKVKL